MIPRHDPHADVGRVGFEASASFCTADTSPARRFGCRCSQFVRRAWNQSIQEGAHFAFRPPENSSTSSPLTKATLGMPLFVAWQVPGCRLIDLGGRNLPPYSA
jgi:hypothetical protein